MNRSVPVDKIYIDLNVLEQLSCSSYVSEWPQKFDPDNQDFDRLGLGRVKEPRVEALLAIKNYSKLMVLGKPGAGKTTLLKSLAVECVQHIMNVFPDTSEWGSGYIYEKRLEEWRQRLSSCLSQHRNLKLDWQFSDEQKQLLNKYYAANKLLVDLLQENHASPEVQKEIQDTLLLPIVEIERRKSGITQKILLDCPQESNAIPEVKETQETLFLPCVEIEKCSSNELQQQAQNMLPSPIDEIADYRQENKQDKAVFSVKIDFYLTILFYSSFLIALILYMVFITVFK